MNTRKILTSILAIALTVSVCCPGAMAFTFEIREPEEIFDTDLIEKEEVSSWAEDEIEQARSAGLITENTMYYMTQATTRFQFAELVVNLVEKVTGETIVPAAADTFTDCGEEVVLKAYAAGIINGVGDNKFEPDTITDREQIATMLYRAINYIEDKTGVDLAPLPASIEGFTDKGDVSDWAVEGVGALAANDIMKGGSDTTLSPKELCTVEQCILLVFRVFKKI